jgi:hypothetical protein
LATSGGAAYVHGLDLVAERRSGARAYPLGDALGSVTRWVKAGYIRVLRKGDPKGGRGRKTHLNEADVAYAKLASEQRQPKPGRRVFTAEFLPVSIGGEAP